MGNVTMTLRQPFQKDSGTTERAEDCRDEAEEADIQLQDDQNIHSAEDGNTDVHLASSRCDKDTPINASCHIADAASTKEEVRYNLRNRTVPSIKVTAVPQDGKRIKDIGLAKSILKNNSIYADKGMQSTRGEIGNKPPASDCTGSRKTNARRQLEHEDATLTEENGNDIPRDADELTKLNSHHSYGGKFHQREKSRKSRSRSAGPTGKGVSNMKSSTRIRSSENSGASVHACNTTPVAPNSMRSCSVAAGDNSTQDQSGKSYESKKKKNQMSSSKLKSNPKTGDSKRERNASQGSTPKKARRKLDYAEPKTPTSAGKKKDPDELSQSSAPKTSRSGRLLLPTMEFWRNQLPIYDADHGISGIRDGTTTLKFERGGKSGGKT